MTDQAKKLKITQKGFESYSDSIGMYRFEDGISVEKISRAERDRLSTVFEMVEISEEGDEQPSGVTHRMASERETKAEVVQEMPRATDEAVLREKIAAFKKTLSLGRKTYSESQLEDVLSKDGISGLREIGDSWPVKDRSAIMLIKKILAAQEAALMSDEEKISSYAEKLGISLEEMKAQLVDEPVTDTIDDTINTGGDDTINTGTDTSGDTGDVGTIDDITAAKLDAAMTGDFSESINQE